MLIDGLDLDTEYEKLRRHLLLLDIRIDREGLDLWKERVRAGKAPFDIRGLTGLQHWTTDILDGDEDSDG